MWYVIFFFWYLFYIYIITTVSDILPIMYIINVLLTIIVDIITIYIHLNGFNKAPFFMNISYVVKCIFLCYNSYIIANTVDQSLNNYLFAFNIVYFIKHLTD